MVSRARAVELVRRVAEFTGGDITNGSREFLLNTVAGSVLVPRIARIQLMKLAGMDIRTWDIRPRVTFVGRPGRLSMAPGSGLNQGVYLELIGDITIGVDTAIGTQCTLITSAHPFDDEGHFSPYSVGEPITIGDRVWLGARVTVLPGVTIGNDCVVAAGAVVTKDLAPGGLYVGVPAKRLRELPQGAWNKDQLANLARDAGRSAQAVARSQARWSATA